MPSMLVIPTVWQPSATPSSPISPQRQQHFSAGPTAPNNNQAILAILSAYDDVIFDFSQPGMLGMSWYNLLAANVTDKVYKISISGNSNSNSSSTTASQQPTPPSDGTPRMELNADIDGVYDWCADQAWWAAENNDQQHHPACSAGALSPSPFTSMSFDPAAIAAVAEARKANREQKVFRFENGHYASSRPRKDLKIVSRPAAATARAAPATSG
ncbi:uncharacterized protein B0I36DRAFT_338599 [Microdochium trichocladiopsis]|uniref:Uncharacterized protein n=1 Tax=Microdochium trichocladiopsis TaxID=1682393 RepID=A0A9P9BG65_9PEZI|nr:uncharacterized protein B0I36DRAFT_338599 [Microdochium trichocladiopsis]KAH7014354.1 hypothetical protein B0I36DRAFT_338599 [Microdochium trichocladiopsis]